MNMVPTTKIFTLAESNRMLPLVSAIVEDWQKLTAQVEEREARLRHLTDGRDLEAGDPYAAELAEVEAELERNRERIQGFVHELEQLGLEPGDAELGTVDFPTRIGERLMRFCWKIGDAEINSWHSEAGDCRNRKKLEVELLSDSEGSTVA